MKTLHYTAFLSSILFLLCLCTALPVAYGQGSLIPAIDDSRTHISPWEWRMHQTASEWEKAQLMNFEQWLQEQGIDTRAC